MAPTKMPEQEPDRSLSAPPAASPPPAPVGEDARIASLDVIRGVAVLGILMMNIQSFSMPSVVYLNPTAYGDLTGAGYAVWWASHLFFDQKFLSIFSMLFGAGIALMAGRIEERGGRPGRIHLRRMGWLALIGLLHAYLLWYGDILFTYALTGLVAYLFRRRRPVTLIAVGLVAIAVSSAVWEGFGWAFSLAPPEAVREMEAETWRPSQEVIDREIATYRGSWSGQLGPRAAEAAMFQTFVFLTLFFWKSGGLMLIGMALLRLGVLDGRLPARGYAALTAAGLIAGLPAILYGIHYNESAGWDVRRSFFHGSQFNYWGSIPMALAWIGAAGLAVRSPRLARLTARLGAVGRMALTNYLMQTVLCTLLFYGHGLGLFGRVSRVGQVGVVLAVWVLELAWSPWWLSCFAFGPAEWAWRSLTYWKVQPFRKKRVLRQISG